MINILLYGFKDQINIKEELTQFFVDHYKQSQIKYANSKEVCLKIIRENPIDCILVNQSIEDISISHLLKSFESNPERSKIPLIGINLSKSNINLNISDAFVGNLFFPFSSEELQKIVDKLIFSPTQNEKERIITLKEKYDTRKSCFALCEAVKNGKNEIIDYQFLEINAEFAEFLDLMIEDIYGGSLKKVFPELGSQFVEMFKATPANGKPLYYECESKWNKKHFELITYQHKKDVVNTIIIDTSDKKNEEENLRVKKQKFGDRLKELRCLNNITKILNSEEIEFEEKLKKIVLVIPWAFQYPENAKVRVVFNKTEIQSSDYVDTEWKLDDSIIVDNKRIGKICVCYDKRKPKKHSGPFLKEEVKLINSICELLVSDINKTEKGNKRNDHLIKTKDELISGLMKNLTNLLSEIEQKEDKIKYLAEIISDIFSTDQIKLLKITPKYAEEMFTSEAVNLRISNEIRAEIFNQKKTNGFSIFHLKKNEENPEANTIISFWLSDKKSISVVLKNYKDELELKIFALLPQITKLIRNNFN